VEYKQAGSRTRARWLALSPALGWARITEYYWVIGY